MDSADESDQPKQSSGAHSAGSAKMAIKSQGEANPMLKRSYSTPTVLSMPQEPAAAAAASTAVEKKRNKLGYHRTSIACTHCRRRKIRCIISPEMQNQCVSCIRLKKDCSFSPVDPQPLTDSRAKSTDLGTGSPSGPSQSSSPAIATAQLDDMTEEPEYGLGPTTDPAVPPAPAIVPSNVGYASVNTEGLAMPISTERNFSVSSTPSLAWGSAEPSPATLSGSMDMGYAWQPYCGDSTPAEHVLPFEPVPSTEGPAWLTGRAAAIQPSNWNWDSNMPPQVPARSLSFSGGFVSQQQHQFVPVPSNAPFHEGGPGLVNVFSPPIHQPAGSGPTAGPVLLASQPGWEQHHQQQHFQQNYQNQQFQQQQQQQQSGQPQNMEFNSWSLSQDGPPPM